MKDTHYAMAINGADNTAYILPNIRLEPTP